MRNPIDDGTDVTMDWTLCDDCGIWFSNQRDHALHTCHPEALVCRLMSRFERCYRAWLKTPHGQFATYLANTTED